MKGAATSEFVWQNRKEQVCMFQYRASPPLRPVISQHSHTRREAGGTQQKFIESSLTLKRGEKTRVVL